MAVSTPKSFQPQSKDVRYINRDFPQLKESLIQFAKSYFPNTYKDFSDSSPGMMFIEMSAYVGDVLSYYTDYIFKESLIHNTQERRNIISLARYLGYKVRASRGATGDLDVYQLMPAQEVDGEYVPDTEFALEITEGMQISNNVGSSYVTMLPVNFSANSALSPRVDSVYSRTAAGVPEFFLCKKTVRIRAGKTVVKNFTVNDPTSFLRLFLDEENTLEVLEVKDSDNNRWYEVDYLAQELVLSSVPNEAAREGSFTAYRNDVPYILQYLRTARRYTTTVNENSLTYLEFGAGLEAFSDELVTMNSQLVGVGLSNINKLNIPYDPSNFLKNDTYGLAPSNTTLTVKYIVGGGFESNAGTDEVTRVISVEYDNITEGLSGEKLTKLDAAKNSLRVTNAIPVTGGKNPETNDEIRQNAMAFFSAQNRAVTKDDYLVRSYSMPPQFGTIAKAQVVTNTSLDVSVNNILRGAIDTQNNASVVNHDVQTYFRKLSYDRSNPFAINLYLLSYNGNRNLVPANEALVNNLINYLKQFRLLTDAVNIIDGYIINIGVEFSISVFKGYNKKDTLLTAIEIIQDFFAIDKWNFSQNINLSQLELEIAKVEGVQSVLSLNIENLNANDGDYSVVEYDIKSATRNKIIYPSIDPSIFEIKFPDQDIKGTVA
jgi:hypothetical protein